MMPASNMKIVTLAAAAETLGWDYTFETRVFAAGTIADGVLAGDLVVVGSGDPSLVAADGMADRVFGDWAARLKQRGVRAVSGRVIGDDNGFEKETLGLGWMWDDLPTDDSAGVGALQYNESAVRVTVAPGPSPGDAAAICHHARGQRPDHRQLGDDGSGGHANLDQHAPPARQHEARSRRHDRRRSRAVHADGLGGQSHAVLRDSLREARSSPTASTCAGPLSISTTSATRRRRQATRSSPTDRRRCRSSLCG